VNEARKIVTHRPLGEIESELLKAESAFAEADDALKKAKKARETALEDIICHQLELDNAIKKLRSAATPGSRWHSAILKNEVVLSSDDDILSLDEEAVLTGPDFDSSSDSVSDIFLAPQLSNANTAKD
jgi:hypothetical protein